MYITEYYGLAELVYPDIFLSHHDRQWILWRRFDDRFLKTADQIHNDFGATYLNTWSFGKLPYFGDQIFSFSCVRPHVMPDGEKWSVDTMHIDWNTGDFKIVKYCDLSIEDKKQAYNEARNFIIKHPKKYPYVTALESGDYAPTWVHLSTGNFKHEDGSIRIIKPS